MFGVSIKNPVGPGPVQSPETHGAGLATAIHFAAGKLEISQYFTSLPDGHHFGVGSRIVGDEYMVVSPGNDFITFHYDASKGAAVVGLHAEPAFLNGEAHKMPFAVGDHG
jgi:hypothetical protein